MIQRHRDPAPWTSGTRDDRLERMMAAAQRGGLIRKTKHRTPVGRTFLIGPTFSFPLLLFPAQGLSLHRGLNAHPYSWEAPPHRSHGVGLRLLRCPGPKLEDLGWRSFEIHTREKKFLLTSQRSAPSNCCAPSIWVSNQKVSMGWVEIVAGNNSHPPSHSMPHRTPRAYQDGETDGECLTGVMPTLLKRKNLCKLSQPHAFVDIFFS